MHRCGFCFASGGYDVGGSLIYSDYFSPPYGGSTGVSVDLIGVGPNVRYLGYFTYLKPPLPTVAITTTPDSPDLGRLYISDNYQPTIEFTEEHTPNLTERFEPTIEWLTTHTINTSDYLEQVRSQGHVSIPIAVKATNVSGIATDTIWVTMLGIDHFALVPDSQSVDHGSSVYFSVQALDIYGNVVDNFYNPQSGDDYPYNIPLTISWDPDTLGEVKVPPQASIARRNNGLALNDSRKQHLPLHGTVTSQKIRPGNIQKDFALRKPITNFPISNSSKNKVHEIRSRSNTATSSLNCTYWDAQYLQFVADGQPAQVPTTVTITVTSADGYDRTGNGHVVVTYTPAFDHFLVNITPDTLSNKQTAPLTVIAVDINGNEVPFDTSTSINLSYDQGQEYAGFITLSNDTVTALPGVSYGTLRLGLIKVVAHGTSSSAVLASAKSLFHAKGIKSTVTTKGYLDQYPQMIVRVVMSTDATRFATGNFYVRPDIKVIVVADSIQPFYPELIPLDSSRVRVKVAVTVSGILYGGPPYEVTITNAVLDGSGGHSHAGSRPTGYLVTADGDTVKIQKFDTGPDTIRSTYQASRFGGQERVIAKLNLPMIADSDSVVVRVPHLGLLPDGSNYELIGREDSHPVNHWADVALLQWLPEIAAEYLEQFEPDNVIKYNDISLPLGGGFDVGGHWDQDLLPDSSGHQLHRLGRSVDVRTNPYHRDGVPINEKDELQDLVRVHDPSATIQIHSPNKRNQHFHIEF